VRGSGLGVPQLGGNEVPVLGVYVHCKVLEYVHEAAAQIMLGL